jgi:hypothetical protein
MNNSIHFYLDAYQKGTCTLNTLVRNVLLHKWNIQETQDASLRLIFPDHKHTVVQGKDLAKHLSYSFDKLQIEYTVLPNESIQLFYDYTAILDFEQFLYEKYPNFTPLDLKYIFQYQHFWFVFDADENYTHTQWLLTPSKEYFFMPAVFTSEDLAEEFLKHPHLPEPESNKERYTLQTNGTRLFAMLRQMPIDQIAFNPFTSQKMLCFSPDFVKEAKLP